MNNQLQTLAPLVLGAWRLADLTHSLNHRDVYWPGEPPFEREEFRWGSAEPGLTILSGYLRLPEHAGTHIDAPRHFDLDGAAVDEIPLDRLVAPAVVIDVSRECRANPDYALSSEKVSAFEQSFGRIAAGSAVLVRTNWSRFWRRPAYWGKDTDGVLHFPGVGAQAAGLLAERQVCAVGIDAPGIDPGVCGAFTAHTILNGSGIYHIENLAHLELLPETGAVLLTLPLKISGGSGAPARVLALIPPQAEHPAPE